MHGQHITITANNANNKIENVCRVGFLPEENCFFQDSKKKAKLEVT